MVALTKGRPNASARRKNEKCVKNAFSSKLFDESEAEQRKMSNCLFALNLS